VVGGSVFLTKSTPPASRVAMKPPELFVKTKGEVEVVTRSEPPTPDTEPAAPQAPVEP
jgi:hypothetical protein